MNTAALYRIQQLKASGRLPQNLDVGRALQVAEQQDFGLALMFMLPTLDVPEMFSPMGAFTAISTGHANILRQDLSDNGSADGTSVVGPKRETTYMGVIGSFLRDFLDDGQLNASPVQNAVQQASQFIQQYGQQYAQQYYNYMQSVL